MINLIRCDDRLIHGQCMTRLVQHYFIKNIIVIDEFTATNTHDEICCGKNRDAGHEKRGLHGGSGR